jgi:uncharacterized protein (TIGR02246 family)
MSSDQEQIRETVARWHAASRAGDVETVLGLMTDDVVFLQPGRPPMRKAEFAELSRARPGAPAPAMDSTQQIEEITVSGDIACMWGRLQVVVTPPGATQPIERAGHTLTVFRRENGRWLLARDANLLTVVQRQDA